MRGLFGKWALPGLLVCAAGIGTLWVQADEVAAPAQSNPPEFRQVVKRVLPAVVSIVAKTTVDEGDKEKAEKQREELKKRLPPEFRKFFDGNVPDDLTPRPQAGFGSGAIVDKRGIILTNNHVVEDADVVQVILQDGREFETDDIKRDPKTDLAIVRLKAEDVAKADLPVAELGDSDLSEIGDWVLAMGSPFGLQGTVTKGIISAKGRTLPGSELPYPRERRLMYQDFLQTDAAINPGNSGGPLVDLNGKIIGINTAIRSNNGQFGGIGFTIPINMAKRVVEQLDKFGRVKRSYLGIAMQPLNRKQLDEKKLQGGIMVTGLSRGETPARKAGLKESDVILSVNGKPVKETQSLQVAVSNTPAGETVKLEVLREGNVVEVAVVLEEQPDTFGTEQIAAVPPESSETPGEGLEILGATFVEEEGKITVAEVQEDSPAASRLEPGDVVLQVERKDVGSIKDLESMLEDVNLKNDGILLKVKKSDGRVSLVVLKEK